LRTPLGILEKGSSMTWRRWTISVWSSSTGISGSIWTSSTVLRFTKKPHSRRYYWDEERKELMPLPPVPYEYMERRTAKVSSDYHVRFDNAYYSVDRAYLHKEVLIRASATTVKIFSKEGEFICEWPRATCQEPVVYRSEPSSRPITGRFPNGTGPISPARP
jgi:hypothetical protein